MGFIVSEALFGDFELVTTSISMPIKSIDNSGIEAGFLFFSSSFELQGNPKTEDGMLVLVVDGERLYKTDELGRVQFLL